MRGTKKMLAVMGLMLLVGAAGAMAVTVPGLGSYQQGVALPNQSVCVWWYGCSPTSAGMLIGNYDRNGYGSLLYDNLVPGGVAEAQNTGGSSALINNAIASAGHIADFYRAGYGAIGDDAPGAPNHAFDCLADFMGTSMDVNGNSNGGTTFYYYNNGAPLTSADIEFYGLQGDDGMWGVHAYTQYAGYDTLQAYTQLTDNLGLPYGFSFGQYMAEIDAGRGVLVHVEGHTMYGYGYDAQTMSVLLYDTWDYLSHSMTWGGSYSGLGQWGVTVIELTGGERPDQTPDAGTTVALLGLALGALQVMRRRAA